MQNTFLKHYDIQQNETKHNDTQPNSKSINFKAALMLSVITPRILMPYVITPARPTESSAQWYDSFYVCNLMFVISLSVCPWQAFPV
jgi:hypothetical protein